MRAIRRGDFVKVRGVSRLLDDGTPNPAYDEGLVIRIYTDTQMRALVRWDVAECEYPEPIETLQLLGEE